MAAHARQQYFADEESIQKQAREFSLVDELKDKLDSIEWGAQVNVIEEVKENGVPLEIVDKSVNVEVPLVIDNLYTIDPDNSLSAKQGKILYDLIQNLASRGRYLSNWNAATGLPTTNPVESPYEYRAGDYYIVSNVAAQGGTNYRPEVGQYIIGQASDEVEHETVKVTDMYLYDGTNWNLLINSTREIAIDSSLSTTSTNPVENRVVTNAINTKQDILIAGNNIQIASDGKTISSTDTTYTAGTNIQIDANNQISATDTTYTAGANIQIDANNQISATDTVYAEGTGIDITNNIISNEGVLTVNGNNGNVTVNDVKVSPTAPANPTEGMIWYDTTNDQLKAWDGTNWNVTGKVYTAGDGIAISAQNVISNTRKSVAVSQTAPANPSAGDLWYNTTKDVMFLYDGSDWTIIGPEIYPITKADYDLLSNAEKTDGRFFLITDNDGTIYVDWANVQNKPNIQGVLTPGDGIDIDANNEISIDASDIVGTGLTEDGNNNLAIDTTVVATKTDLNSKQDKFHTTSSSAPSNPSEGDEWYDSTNDVLKVYDGTNWIVTGKTYTAGTNIDITNDVISADKQFEVVSTLPSVATASEDKVYILGPLNVDGADKYEEWIVTNQLVNETFTAAGTPAWNYDPSHLNLSNSTTLTYVSSDGSGNNGFILDDNLGNVYGYYTSNNIFQNTGWYQYDEGTGDWTFIDSTSVTVPAGNYELSCGGGDSSFDSITISTGASKQWTKIGETSIDLSNYLAKNNTTSYTPSGDYNPATKKYVDDNKGKKDIVISQTAPSDKTVLWFNNDPDTSAAADLLYYNNYAGGSWQSLGGIYSSSSAPSGSNKLWYDTSDSTIKYYDNNTHSWESVGGVKYVEGFGIDFSSPYGDEVEIAVDPDDLAGSGLSVNQGNGQLQVDTTVIQEKLTAGDGIDIDNNNEISVDASDLAGTGLSTDANNNLIVDTTVIQEKLIAGDGITIGNVCTDISDMQGPAPKGFHVPLTTEWQGLKTIMDGLSLTTGDNWRINLHIPLAGRRSYSNAVRSKYGSIGSYWSSSPYRSSNPNDARYLYLDSSDAYASEVNRRADGFSVRCFKDSYETPTSSWTIITGTLGGAGIFRNQTDGLISITSNGTTGYTIQDKNLGATTVYNNGDTLSEANCGKYYQWGNNYGFPSTGSITTSSTQVDANTYGPGNYYSSSTFIIGSNNWSSVSNDNLRGGVSQGSSQECDLTISADTTVVATKTDLSGKQDKFHTTSSSAPSNPSEGDEWYDTVNDVLKVYDGTNWNEAGGGIKSSNNTYEDIIHLSQAEYDNLQNKDPNTLYSTPDDESGAFEPENVGTTGQVLTKTATGYAYANPTGGSTTTITTLTTAGWSSKEQTVSVTGVTASNTIIVSPAPANINDYASCSIYCSAQGSGTLTFKCNTVPSDAITVNVLILS